MENDLDRPEWLDKVYYRWVFLPMMACFLSLLDGFGGLLLCPILLTVAQYLTLRRCAAIVRPGLWFATLPITLLVWWWWLPYHAIKPHHGVLYIVGAYYGGQLLNALLIPMMTEKQVSSTAFTGSREGIDLTIRWMLASILAAGVWVALYGFSTLLGSALMATQQLSVREFWQWVSYFSISLFANAIGGLVLKGMERED